MKFKFLFFLLIAGISGWAQQPDSVQKYLDSALNVMQSRSLATNKLHWKVIRDSAHQLAANAKDYAGVEPALKFAFNLLNDKHGWLVLDGKQYVNPFLKHDNSRINEATRSVISKPAIRSARLHDQFAYLSIPFFGGQTLNGMNDFAQKIQDSLGKVAVKPLKGIIIDLRLNGGGNLFPMVVGISNIIGNGKLTESVLADGSTEGVTVMKNYTLTLLDTMVVQLRRHYGNYEKLPVAVLIGPATGSSGEQLAIILSTRKNTILIGEHTAGYVTANNGFRLPGKGNGIVLGESYTKDSNGKVFMDDVAPGIYITGGDDFAHLQSDKKVQAAISWIREQAR